MSESVDSSAALQVALDALLKNPHGQQANEKFIGAFRRHFPRLQEELGQLRASAKSYVAVIRDPDEETIVETQGSVEVFTIDLGGSIDIDNAAEVDAVEALELAAGYARDGAKVPPGVVQDTIYGAVEQLVEAYSEYKDAATYLSEEDRVALADWLPKVPEVSPA